MSKTKEDKEELKDNFIRMLETVIDLMNSGCYTVDVEDVKRWKRKVKRL